MLSPFFWLAGIINLLADNNNLHIIYNNDIAGIINLPTNDDNLCAVYNDDIIRKKENYKNEKKEDDENKKKKNNRNKKKEDYKPQILF